MSFDNGWWDALSIIQAAHAAELLIKARIAEEHPLLIFESLPKEIPHRETLLTFEHLSHNAHTVSYMNLPDRLWASTGTRLQNSDVYREFGKLRNIVQHFAVPARDQGDLNTLQFIYKVVDPFIFTNWGLYAIDQMEDEEEYQYRVERLVHDEIEFLVPPDVLDEFPSPPFEEKTSQHYRDLMSKRFKEAEKQR